MKAASTFLTFLLTAIVLLAFLIPVRTAGAQIGQFDFIELHGSGHFNSVPNIAFLPYSGEHYSIGAANDRLRINVGNSSKFLLHGNAPENSLILRQNSVLIGNNLVLDTGSNPWLRFNQSSGSPHFLATWNNRMVMYVDSSPKVYVYENAEPGALRVGVGGVNVNDLILRGGNGDDPFIRFDQDNGDHHFLATNEYSMRFILDESTKFRIDDSAEENALVISSRGVAAKELTVEDRVLYLNPVPQNGDRAGMYTTDGQSIGLRTSNANFPFYIHHNANSESLSITQNGVGIGTFDPQEMLHLFSDGNDRFPEARLVIENDQLSTRQRDMFELVNNGGSRFSLTDTNLNTSWAFASDSLGRFSVSLDDSGGPEFVIQRDGRVLMGPGPLVNFDLRSNGNLHIRGTLFQSSDENLKEAFSNVDCETVLQRLVQMPVTTWQFKSDATDLRHMGPTAQDFRAAFGLGIDDKSIAPVDGIGVSLAAIQALNNKIVEQQTQLAEQNDLIQQLSTRLDQLESK